MKQKIVVLRRSNLTMDPFAMGFEVLGGPGGGPTAAATPPRIELEEAGPADLRKLAQDRGVAAFAPLMPTMLVEPVVGGATGTAWGVEAVGAHTCPFDGSGVKVAVLDTGIDAAHPAFDGVTLTQRNFTSSGATDAKGHGTHCAGTIFGRDVRGTRIGVARGVTHALIGKVLGDDGRGSSEALFQALSWSVNEGARVISMSLGFDFTLMSQELGQFMPERAAVSAVLEAYRANLRVFDSLMAYAHARVAMDGGAVVVAASGNESKRPEYEINVSMPAAADRVVSVGALGRAGPSYTVAPFSNSLPAICGPGVDVLSARVGGGLTASSGTSMATPHVAGVAALWWQALQTTGVPVNAINVVAKLLATARLDQVAPDIDIADRGSGMVAAPR